MMSQTPAMRREQPAARRGLSGWRVKPARAKLSSSTETTTEAGESETGEEAGAESLGEGEAGDGGDDG